MITKYVESFIVNDIVWKENYEPLYFTIKDLQVSLSFDLISEGLLLNEKSYSEAIALKVKLHQISSGNYGKFFDYKSFITLDQYISSLIMISNTKKAQIINFTLEDVDDRFAKEGRKYGIILDLITQRPTELGGSVISQCSNFLIF